MRFLVSALFVILLSQTASAQLIGQCSLSQLAEKAGDCTQCPPGGQGYANCTVEESTYDASCVGICLLNRTCVPTATENLPVYILYMCIDDCDDPLFPSCAKSPSPVQVLDDDVPIACGCNLQ